MTKKHRKKTPSPIPLEQLQAICDAITAATATAKGAAPKTLPTLRLICALLRLNHRALRIMNQQHPPAPVDLLEGWRQGWAKPSRP